jgi:hypothetical protein
MTTSGKALARIIQQEMPTKNQPTTDVLRDLVGKLTPSPMSPVYGNLTATLSGDPRFASGGLGIEPGTIRKMGKSARAAALAVLLGILGAASPQAPLLPFPVFPSDNPWNWDISGFAVHPDSATYINSIGASAPIREDYSFYFSIVDNTQTDVNVTMGMYADESDPGPLFGSPAAGSEMNPGDVAKYPIPSNAQIEGGGDAHVLVINTTRKLLYETYQTAGPPWSATNGAIFDLASNQMRPDGWTSGDAAGLPIFPGLIRYDEAVTAGAINHALRVTCPSTQNQHIYPARHDAGSANTNLPPMGLRLRLKASKDLSGYSGAALAVLTALKKHGLIVADNGSAWYISTAIHPSWGSSLLPIRDMRGSDFEVVVSVDASGNPILPVSGGGSGPPPPSPPSGGGAGSGGGGGGGCGLLGIEILALRLLRRRNRMGERLSCRYIEERPVCSSS